MWSTEKSLFPMRQMSKLLNNLCLPDRNLIWWSHLNGLKIISLTSTKWAYGHEFGGFFFELQKRFFGTRNRNEKFQLCISIIRQCCTGLTLLWPFIYHMTICHTTACQHCETFFCKIAAVQQCNFLLTGYLMSTVKEHDKDFNHEIC